MHAWTSEAIHINPYTCIDVKADCGEVVVGQVDAASLHNVHMPIDIAEALGHAILKACMHARQTKR